MSCSFTIYTCIFVYIYAYVNIILLYYVLCPCTCKCTYMYSIGNYMYSLCISMYSTCVQNNEQSCYITYCTLFILFQVIVGVADPILGGDTE